MRQPSRRCALTVAAYIWSLFGHAKQLPQLLALGLVACGIQANPNAVAVTDGSSTESGDGTDTGSGLESTDLMLGTEDESSTEGEAGVCGDGIIDPQEACDDGNTVDGDGCSADCEVRTCFVPTTHYTITAGIEDADCAIIYISAGNYIENVEIMRDVQLRGAASELTVIDGGRAGTTITVGHANVVIEQLTIESGLALTGGGLNAVGSMIELRDVNIRDNEVEAAIDGSLARGAGVYLYQSELTLTAASRIENNLASATAGGDAYGAGVYAEESALSVTEGSAIDNNTIALTNIGDEEGGAAGGGAYLTDSSLSLTGASSLSGNTISADHQGFYGGGSGGGVYAHYSAINIVDSEFSNNSVIASGTGDSYGYTSVSAGGLYAWDTDVSIQRSNVENNAALASCENSNCSSTAGAIYFMGENNTVLDIDDSTFIDNHAEAIVMTDDPWGSYGSAEAGVIYLFSRGVIDIDRTTLSGNWVYASGRTRAGAIYLIGTTGDATAVLDCDNTTFSGNFAQNEDQDASGGVLYLDGGTGSSQILVTFANVTMTNNGADYGGAFQTSGGIANSVMSLAVRNSIMAGNVADVSPDCRNVGGNGSSLKSEGFNIIGSTEGCSITGSHVGNITGVDPGLAPLADNGGDSWTHALMPGSPARDAGNMVGCLDSDGAPLITDQRGLPRIGGGVCDIGAFEVQL